jgi:endoglucanase
MKKLNFLFVILGIVLMPGMNSEPSFSQTLLRDTMLVVDRNGQIRVQGNRIVNQQGDTIALHGMSLFWSQWMGKYYNYECIQWLRDDWHCDVVRAAVGVEHGGYLNHPEREMKKVKNVIESCIDLGIYVIVDWHSHAAERSTEAAIAFFTEIAKVYGDKPNVIYEIYNEPVRVNWEDVIKPYSEKVIKAIREIDPDNIIVAGTSHWSQDVDLASMDPLTGSNIAYALHFYAGTHKQWLRDKCDVALDNGMAVWVTEFGTCASDGNGKIDKEETEAWMAYMEKNQISWCNWSVADKAETASVIKPRSNNKGGWSEKDLTESGKLIRELLRK